MNKQVEPKFKVGDKVLFLNEEYMIEGVTDHYILRSTKEHTSVPVVHIDFGHEDYELELARKQSVEEAMAEVEEKAKLFTEAHATHDGNAEREQARR